VLRRGWLTGLWGGMAAYATLFLLYSQTSAFAWDETYHLLAAQLILAGKKPYLDFCFPQTPLNAYWNAGWMSVLGQNWRVAHGLAALLTIGAVVLTADFVGRRFPVAGWRVPGTLTVGLATGLNAMVFHYGPLGQPYAMCLFALAAAFRIALRAVTTSSVVLAAAAGVFAGIAAGSSLLSVAAAPVLVLWIMAYNRAGSRWFKLAAFSAGAAIPFVPVLWLCSLGPRQAWFNLVQYHGSFRKLYWPETTRHDLEVLTSWIDSGQGLLIGLLALFGLLFVARRSEWPRERKAEFYLCAWLSAALAVEVGRAHPTFPQYFLLIVPFLAILAVAGVYAIGSRVLEPDRPFWPVILVIALTGLGMAQSLYRRREDYKWRKYERLAVQIDRVTPRDGLLFADEPIYFLTERAPPPGYELGYSHKVTLPAQERALMHILTEAEVKKQVQSGMFATAYSCDEDEIEDYGLKKLYRRRWEDDGCSVFWERERVGNDE
jgi:hypothetical protein